MGVQFVSSSAGANRSQLAGRARYLRGDADGRGQIVVLPVAGAGVGEDGSGDFSFDCVDAGSGGGFGANGDSGGGVEQHFGG